MLTPMTPPAQVLSRRNFSRITCDIFIMVARVLESGLEIFATWLPTSAVPRYFDGSTVESRNDRLMFTNENRKFRLSKMAFFFFFSTKHKSETFSRLESRERTFLLRKTRVHIALDTVSAPESENGTRRPAPPRQKEYRGAKSLEQKIASDLAPTGLNGAVFSGSWLTRHRYAVPFAGAVRAAHSRILRPFRPEV